MEARFLYANFCNNTVLIPFVYFPIWFSQNSAEIARLHPTYSQLETKQVFIIRIEYSFYFLIYA